jgi:glycosyltransferase involved in cell wall biosynthesis
MNPPFNAETRPYFSICVPQYSRVKHLIHALNELQYSSFKNFEVCISDDMSPEHEYQELAAWLKQSSLQYQLHRRESSGRYDINLRTSLGLAKGEYLVLMGNDDCFESHDSLEQLKQKLEQNNLPDILIPNYQGFSDGEIVKRVNVERLYEGGVESAKVLYRSFAFVSGLIFKRKIFNNYDSDRWDGTEMYQMGVGCAAILDGAITLTILAPIIKKDILIAGQSVDSYQNRPPKDATWSAPIETTLTSLTVVIAKAFDASTTIVDKDKQAGWLRCVSGLYLYTFPYWIYNYKSVFGFKVAYRLFHTLSPNSVAGKNRHPNPANFITSQYYFLVGAVILMVPSRLFEWLQPLAYRIAKSGK